MYIDSVDMRIYIIATLWCFHVFCNTIRRIS